MLARILSGLCCVAIFGCAKGANAPLPNHDAPRTPAAGALRKSGTVHLSITCKPDVQRDFQSSLALLHSFFYEEARREFRDLAARDSTCAMAYWGQAMTYYHPLWTPPTPAEMAEGKKAAKEARARLGGVTDLERTLVEAIDAFFRTDDDDASAD